MTACALAVLFCLAVSVGEAITPAQERVKQKNLALQEEIGGVEASIKEVEKTVDEYRVKLRQPTAADSELAKETAEFSSAMADLIEPSSVNKAVDSIISEDDDATATTADSEATTPMQELLTDAAIEVADAQVANCQKNGGAACAEAEAAAETAQRVATAAEATKVKQTLLMQLSSSAKRSRKRREGGASDVLQQVAELKREVDDCAGSGGKSAACASVSGVAKQAESAVQVETKQQQDAAQAAVEARERSFEENRARAAADAAKAEMERKRIEEQRIQTANSLAELESIEEERAADQAAKMKAMQDAAAAKAAADAAMLKSREAQALLDAARADKNKAAIERAQAQLLAANQEALEAETASKAAADAKAKSEAAAAAAEARAVAARAAAARAEQRQKEMAAQMAQQQKAARQATERLARKLKSLTTQATQQAEDNDEMSTTLKQVKERASTAAAAAAAQQQQAASVDIKSPGESAEAAVSKVQQMMKEAFETIVKNHGGGAAGAPAAGHANPVQVQTPNGAVAATSGTVIKVECDGCDGQGSGGAGKSSVSGAESLDGAGSEAAKMPDDEIAALVDNAVHHTMSKLTETGSVTINKTPAPAADDSTSPAPEAQEAFVELSTTDASPPMRRR